MDFYRAQWNENEAETSVFMMEGLSEWCAIKLLKLARGRYCLAWTYLHVYRRHGIEYFNRAELFDELPDRDRVTREQCSNPTTKEALKWVAPGFLTAAVIGFAGHLCAIICQDAREFFQRNPDLLG
jgi:hypothetical protein